MGKFNFKVLLLLSCGHMVVDLYQGALPAILPFLKDHLDLSYTMAGVILIVSNTTSSIIQPAFGMLSDRREKAFLLPMGAFLAGAGFCLLPFTSDYKVVLLLVAISGIGVASYHPEGFKTARFFTGPKVATGMSVFSVGGNTGMALGPILALTIVGYLGFASLWWMALPALLFTAAIILLHRTVALPKSEQVRADGKAARSSRQTYVTLVVLLAVIILRTWTQIGLVTYIPFYHIDYLHGSPVLAGQLVGSLLFGGAFGTLVGAPLADKWGHRFWLRLSMLVCTLLFPLILWAKGAALFLVVVAFGVTLISTFSVTVVMGQNLLPRNLGVASGLMVGFAIGAGGIGVTLLGVIADHYGVPVALKCIGVLPLLGFLLTLMLRYPVAETAGTTEAAQPDAG